MDKKEFESLTSVKESKASKMETNKTEDFNNHPKNGGIPDRLKINIAKTVWAPKGRDLINGNSFKSDIDNNEGDLFILVKIDIKCDITRA